MTEVVVFDDAFIKDNVAKMCENIQKVDFLYTGKIPKIGQKTETQISFLGYKWFRMSGEIIHIYPEPAEIVGSLFIECGRDKCIETYGAVHGQRLKGTAKINGNFHGLNLPIKDNDVVEIEYVMDDNFEQMWIATSIKNGDVIYMFADESEAEDSGSEADSAEDIDTVVKDVIIEIGKHTTIHFKEIDFIPFNQINKQDECSLFTSYSDIIKKYVNSLYENPKVGIIDTMIEFNHFNGTGYAFGDLELTIDGQMECLGDYDEFLLNNDYAVYVYYYGLSGTFIIINDKSVYDYGSHQKTYLVVVCDGTTPPTN